MEHTSQSNSWLGIAIFKAPSQQLPVHTGGLANYKSMKNLDDNMTR